MSTRTDRTEQNAKTDNRLASPGAGKESRGTHRTICARSAPRWQKSRFRGQEAIIQGSWSDLNNSNRLETHFWHARLHHLT